ncbi:MAG: DNA/RNA nuclease SfsA [Firmicutes bacterium]|nr:DNA/RNA nuclease SfsA [Bacillota bacterium]
MDVVPPGRTSDEAPSVIPCVKRDDGLIEGTFISRPNRFFATVRLKAQSEPGGGFEGYGAGERCPVNGDGEVGVHVADPGRLKELLVPGRTVYVARVGDASGDCSVPGGSCAARGGRPRAAFRKTAYDLALVDHDGLLVSVDSRVPNHLVFAALRSGFFPDLAVYPDVRRECVYGESRIDFRLSGSAAGDCLLEVKSVTLVRGGRALFPDAPTARGARHVRELARAAAEGLRAAVMFIIQREDADSLSPNDETDPGFGAALRDAARSGVEVRAYTCRVARERICLYREVPVAL